MDKELTKLVTEQVNEETLKIDRCTTREMLLMMNEEDQKVPLIVKESFPEIEQAVEGIVARMQSGGKLFYIGAGTSGRIGVLDASECSPTFGVNQDLVQAIIAGGNRAWRQAQEGIEDDESEGRNDIEQYGIGSKDVVIGITASGRTPYVLAAMEKAGHMGAFTIGICNNENSELEKFVDVLICVPVGPEVIVGSTRLKAGTAQKMVLNMLSTVTMIRLGKVYRNLMVSLKPTNHKLEERAKQIIKTATEVEYDIAAQYFKEANGNIKAAIIMIEHHCDLQTATMMLEENQGYVIKALKNIENRLV